MPRAMASVIGFASMEKIGARIVFRHRRQQPEYRGRFASGRHLRRTIMLLDELSIRRSHDHGRRVQHWCRRINLLSHNQPRDEPQGMLHVPHLPFLGQGQPALARAPSLALEKNNSVRPAREGKISNPLHHLSPLRIHAICRRCCVASAARIGRNVNQR